MRPAGEKYHKLQAATVRAMKALEVSAALSILSESPGAAIWSKESLLEWASKGRAWVTERNGTVAGFLIAQIASDELEILDVAVKKEYRRQGVATDLLRAVLDWGYSAGARRVYLEVRASNEAGFSFYTHWGFQVYGRRPNYYRAPVEDALLLILHNVETFC